MAVTIALPLSVGAQGIDVRVGVTRGDSGSAAARQAREDTLAFRRDSAWAAHDSAAGARRRATAVTVTPRLLATAFRDPRARDLLARARAARAVQDSSLGGYDATAYERMSVGYESGRAPGERLVARAERATRIRWRRGAVAVIDVTGDRSGSPLASGVAIDLGPDDAPVPYFPGQEALWVGSGLAKENAADRATVHPLAKGAEAYYTYASGDSFALRLDGHRALVVRELRVRPRASGWHVVVGSLWLDAATGKLVRAIYRRAAPTEMGLTSDDGEHTPLGLGAILARALTPTVTMQLSTVTVDYGLFEGRFWLPRAQTVDGSATIGGVRLPMHLRQHFTYASVNEPFDLPPVQLRAADTAHTLAAYVERRAAPRRACPDTTGERVLVDQRYEDRLSVVTRIPCNTAALARSASLPPSLYADVDTLFDERGREALADDVLGLADVGGLAPQRPSLRYGVGLTRYNRVEGLSTAAEVRQAYGAGLTGRALVRAGFADRSLNGEVALTRSNGRDSVTFGAYRRLAAANDWGDPFSLGASLTTLLFGRDDGMYYRTAGVALSRGRAGGLVDVWRLFAERQWDATPRARLSLPHALNGHDFAANLDAESGRVAGLALRRHGLLGEDPSRTRALSDFRVEGVVGRFDYVRAMLDLTLDRPLAAGLGVVVTASGGTSGGHLPTQRYWYLGGPYTVRGQPVGAAAGNAYWLSRLELGSRTTAMKPVVFADVGWAGDRAQWREDVRPIGGAGMGVSFLGGLLRFDVAKGIRPSRGVQVNAYFGARF